MILSAQNTSSSFATFGHMKQAGQQEIKKMSSGRKQVNLQVKGISKLKKAELIDILMNSD